MRVFLAAIFLFLISGAQAQLPTPEIFSAMIIEAERSKAQLRYEDYPTPYFIGLRATKNLSWQKSFRDGEEVFSNEDQKWSLLSQVRVGDYQFDESPDSWSEQRLDGPIAFSTNTAQVRHYLRNAIDDSYKQACGAYLQKKAKRSAEGVPEYATDDFAFLDGVPLSRLNPIGDDPRLASLMSPHEEAFKKLSQSLAGEPLILRSLVRANADWSRSYLVTTEGTRTVLDKAIFEVYMSLYGRSRIGLPLHVTRSVAANDSAKLPSLEKLQAAVTQMKSEFFMLYESSEAKGAFAPCLFDQQASAEIFLAFVSKLEGERQRDPQEPQTFRGKISQQVLPAFLSIVDDPTKESVEDEPLLGHYDFDEEGVRAKEVILVEKGILKNFLLSRRPVKFLPAVSNGHGRGAPDQMPHARAANVFIKSSSGVDQKKLKAMLISEIKRRKMPFGIRVEGIEPLTQEDRTGSHQTFRGAPRLMYYVYPDGREELVHHGEVVGTPIKLMQSILATGDQVKVFNITRGGPGGELPVSVISPAVLISEIEVQKGPSRPMRAPILKSPLEE